MSFSSPQENDVWTLLSPEEMSDIENDEEATDIFDNLSIKELLSRINEVSDSIERRREIKSFIDETSISSEEIKSMLNKFSGYLDPPSLFNLSPDLWIDVLNVFLDLPVLDEYNRDLITFKLGNALKNRIGSKAANFEFVHRDSFLETDLYSIATGKEGLVLIFYDPDCQHCIESLLMLSESDVLNNLVTSGAISVAAIDSEDDRELWRQTSHILPEEWTVGLVVEDIQDNDLYDLPSPPVIYLLDTDYRVVNKDLSAPQLIDLLNGLKNP